MASAANQAVQDLLEEYVNYKMRLPSRFRELYQSTNCAHENLLQTVKSEDERTVLHCAVSRRERNDVAFFVRSAYDRYALIASKDICGQTPVHIAARNGSWEFIEMMLNSLFFIEQQHQVLAMQDYNGMNALDLACRNDKVETAITLNKYIHRKTIDPFVVSYNIDGDAIVGRYPSNRRPAEPHRPRVAESPKVDDTNDTKQPEEMPAPDEPKEEANVENAPSDSAPVNESEIQEVTTNTGVIERDDEASDQTAPTVVGLPKNHLSVIVEQVGSSTESAATVQDLQRSDRGHNAEREGHRQTIDLPGEEVVEMAAQVRSAQVRSALISKPAVKNLQQPLQQTEYICNNINNEGKPATATVAGGIIHARLIDKLQNQVMEQKLTMERQANELTKMAEEINRLSAERDMTSKCMEEKDRQIIKLEERVRTAEVRLVVREEIRNHQIQNRENERVPLQPHTHDADLKYVILLGLLYINGIGGAGMLLFLYLLTIYATIR